MIRKITEWMSMGRMVAGLLVVMAGGMASITIFHFRLDAEERATVDTRSRLSAIERQVAIYAGISSNLNKLEDIINRLSSQGQHREVLMGRFDERVSQLLKRMDELERKLP